MYVRLLAYGRCTSCYVCLQASIAPVTRPRHHEVDHVLEGPHSSRLLAHSERLTSTPYVSSHRIDTDIDSYTYTDADRGREKRREIEKVVGVER